jgi:hypothetical protein
MTSISQSSSVQLFAACQDGNRTTATLADGASLLVGSAPSCGLRISGRNVARCHCMISSEQGILYVQDWASPEGTRINDEVIDGRVEWLPGNVLRLGDAEVHIGKPTDAVAREDARGENQQTDDHRPTAEVTFDPPIPAVWESFADSGPHDSLSAKNQTDSSDTTALPWIDDPWETLTTSSLPASSSNVELSNHDSEHTADLLVDRIDQLLAEIVERDSRLTGLHQLLLAAEDANQAQSEEHRQLNAWVDDLERHINRQESLRDAEIKCLREELDETNAELSQCRCDLQQALSGDTIAKQFEDTIARLQTQNNQLAAERSEYRNRIAQLEQSYSELSAQSEHAMREERIQLAHERADLSRMKCQLAQRIADTDERLSTVSKNEQEADLRTRALREHLREIHAAERTQVPQLEEDTLGLRVSRLWKRLSTDRQR